MNVQHQVCTNKEAKHTKSQKKGIINTKNNAPIEKRNLSEQQQFKCLIFSPPPIQQNIKARILFDNSEKITIKGKISRIVHHF